MKKTAIIAGALIVLLLVSCRGGNDTAAQPTSEAQRRAEALRGIRTQTVAISSFHKAIDTTGTVAFNQDRSTQVLSPISGPVSRILVNIGTRVRRDEPLAVVSSPDFAAAVSALRKAEATALNTKRIADRDEQLFKNDAIARGDLEQAQTDAINAAADRDAAIQQLRSLGVSDATIADIRANRPVPNLGGVIRTPINGTIVEKLITPGQLLQASTPCFTVADLSDVWVYANVFEADLPSVHVGDVAEISAGSGQTLTGRVNYIAALVDPNTRAVSVRIDVPNPGEVLKKDFYVHVQLHSRGLAQGILVPVSAVLRDADNLPFVFVTKPDGSYERRRVDLGTRVGNLQEVRNGLTPGESIVVEGGLFLQNQERL